MLVRDRMTPNPITITPETTHKQANELMKEHHIHHLPVLDRAGKLVGIVVYEDLLSAQPSPATTLSIYEIHSLLSRLQVRDLMTHPVFTVNVDCPLEEAARMMLAEDIGCLPVMDRGQLVGIITDTDIFQTFVALLGGGEEGARFTVRLPDKPGTLAKLAQVVANAGGNIISATTWRDESAHYGYVTIKERGANFAQLEQALAGQEAEVVDVREKTHCAPEQYG